MIGRQRWAQLWLVLASGLIAACGDSKASAPSYVGEEKSLELAAGEQGTLSVGAAALVLPEGALKDDTEISVNVKAKSGLPDVKNIALDVYDYGPDGTHFDKPVKLSFDMQGVKVPKGKRVQVAFLEGSKWTTLSTTVKDDKASAETTHFTPYTLLFVLDEQIGGQCDVDFEPCGGDLVGTWEYTSACITAPAGALGEIDGASPFAMCDDKPVASYDVDLVGKAVFGQDGSFSSEQKVTFSGGYRISKACLAQVGESMGTQLTCAQVDGVPDGDGCLLGSPDVPEMSEESSTGTYTVSGKEVTVIDDSDTDPSSPPKANPYCVRGDQLMVRLIDNDDGAVIVYQGRRK
jgi:hypothetical protein